jgi:rfaE bifunctional protein nucleotidyltransferase chain/domain
MQIMFGCKQANAVNGTLLDQASALGDVLIVAVNDDEGVRRLKCPGRPVNALADRMGVLAALECVDHVVAFGEATPCAVVRALKPDVFVKGGD